MSSPTQRTMAELKKLGFTSHIVEHFNPWVKRRQDCYGFGDILACREGNGILLIQTTAGSGHAARREKILAEPKALAWLKAGGRVEVWSWAKQGAKGKRKTWTLRREEITAELIAA